MLLKRYLITLPFALFAGISNVIWDRAAAFTIGGVTVSFGLVSLCTILFRTGLCVMAVLLLAAVTPLAEITRSMARLRIPSVFVMMFEITYRYIGVLFEEAYSMYIAYSLRSTGIKGSGIKRSGIKRSGIKESGIKGLGIKEIGEKGIGTKGIGIKGIDIKDMGSFAGALLLRAFDRAERVYHAMQCRGYTVRPMPGRGGSLEWKDWIFGLAVGMFCMVLRFI
jgi:cobalt/nickel transport system permease protein